MKKDVTDFIGSLLFDGNVKETRPTQLHFRSEKQIHINKLGLAEKEQSVLTDIYVAKDAVYMSYTLPDGNEVSFTTPLSDIECDFANDYYISRIVCTASNDPSPDSNSVFVLECGEDSCRFFEQKRVGAERTYFEIFQQAE